MATNALPTKRLRSCEPDLKIMVRYETDNEKLEQKEYEMYGAVLGKMSGFVDIALSSGMREQTNREIVFDGVTPEVFEHALKFEEDHVAARTMKVEDALKVVSFYHQYDFPRGLNLCDYIFKEYLSKHPCDDYQTPPEDLDLLVNVIAEAERLDLTESKPLGIAYIHSRFVKTKLSSSTLTATMFTLQHLTKLQKLLKNNEIFDECDLTKEELGSLLVFPRFIFERLKQYVRHIDFERAAELVRRGSKEITLVGLESEADGPFRLYQHHPRGASFFFYKETVSTTGGLHFICRNVGDDWLIQRLPVANTSSWYCPYSKHFMCPPEGPWIPVVPCVGRASPTIKYD